MAPSLRRRWTSGAFALVLTAGGIVIAVETFLGESAPQVSPTAEPVDLEGRVVAEVDAGRFPQEVAFGHGAVWVVANETGRSESWYLARIDPATNRITDRIEIFEAADVATGPDAVWVTGRDRELGQAVYRVDPEMLAIEATIPLDCGRCHADQIVASEEAVWLTVSTYQAEFGEVIRIDPVTNTIVGRVRVPGSPRDLVVGQKAVWVYALTHFGQHGVQGGSLYRIDPDEPRHEETLLAGEIPPASGINTPPILAANDGYIWTMRQQGHAVWEIVRIVEGTGEREGFANPSTNFFPFATGNGSIWFRGGTLDAHPAIARIDAERRFDLVLEHRATILDGALDSEGDTIWLTTHEGPVLGVELSPR